MDSRSPVDLPAADWYPDPSGRHELRYWEGAAWTQNVADGGQMSVDPADGQPPHAVVAQPAQAVGAGAAQAVQAQSAQAVRAPRHPIAQGTVDRGKRAGKRTPAVIVLCAVVALAGVIAAGVVLNQRHQHAAAMAAQAKVADNLGSEFSSDATDYTDTLAGIEPALAQNAVAVKAWKDKAAILQAEYRKNLVAYAAKVAAVNAYNSSRWIPNVRTPYFETSNPGYLLYLEPKVPSGNVWWSDGGKYANQINGVLTKRPRRPRGPRRKLPAHPKLRTPSRIKDPVASSVDTLEGLTGRLNSLIAELDSAQLGPEFLPVAGKMKSGIELLQTQIDLALTACRQAVRHDRRMGYVAVRRNLEGVDVSQVGAVVEAIRTSLLDAAHAHGVALTKLTWTSSQ